MILTLRLRVGFGGGCGRRKRGRSARRDGGRLGHRAEASSRHPLRDPDVQVGRSGGARIGQDAGHREPLLGGRRRRRRRSGRGRRRARASSPAGRSTAGRSGGGSRRARWRASVSAVRVLVFPTRSPAGAASIRITGRSPSATTPLSSSPSPVAAISRSPETSTATGVCSSTRMRSVCGKSVWTCRLGDRGVLRHGVAQRALAHVQRGHVAGRRRRARRARAASSLEVEPVTSTSRTAASEESRSHIQPP